MRAVTGSQPTPWAVIRVFANVLSLPPTRSSQSG